MCSTSVKPVCGDNGITYQSPCIAACAGATGARSGYCKHGGEGLQFARGSRRGAKERQSVITRDVMQRFSGAGFSYLGRVELAPAPSGELPPRARANSTLERGGGGGARQEAGGAAAARQLLLRYTSTGDVYFATIKAAATVPLRIPPVLPPSLARRGKAAAVNANATGRPRAAAAAAAAAPGRSLRMIIGADERSDCGQPPSFPVTAVGQLDFVTQNQGFICSGALVRRDKVLTAAHCVWSVAERAFVRGLSFAAGRYRTPDGAVVSPFGQQRWSHVTLVSNLPSLGTPGSDMAVVHLGEEVGEEAGTMGVDAACPPRPVPLQVQTAGYASDRYSGECVTDRCRVSIGCEDLTPHTCDTFMGQSGSPFWDASNMVRGVHVRGMPTVNEFSNVNSQTLRTILSG